MIPDHVRNRHLAYILMARRARLAGNAQYVAYWLTSARLVRQAYAKKIEYNKSGRLIRFI